MAKICSALTEHAHWPITVYTPARWNGYPCERSVVVITERCQRLNPGSSPGARTIGFQHLVCYSFFGQFSPILNAEILTDGLSMPTNGEHYG